MRLKKLIIGDIKFQLKYGFYLVYSIFTLLYVCLIFALSQNIRNKAATIMIFTDPAAMGMFFMGAIILLEKSQRVLNSIVVSPVKVREYIASKCISLGIISTIVAVIIALFAGNDNIFSVIVGTLFGSILFTLFGMIVGSKVGSLNQFILATVPFEIICFIPPLLYYFGYKKSFLLAHPGVVIINFISDNSNNMIVSFFVLLAWIALIYKITNLAISKMFKNVGGVKL